MLNLADSTVWFSRNPAAASMVLITATCTKLRNPFSHAQENQDNLEAAKKRAVEEPVERMSIGTGVLFVLLFFALYLIVMLMHGWLAP